MRVEAVNFVDESGVLLFTSPFGNGAGQRGWPPADLFHQPDLRSVLPESARNSHESTAMHRNLSSRV